ncbi:Histone acetyltransferase HPA2/related acetyltransferase [Hahella chejuensis KCTC 2396]|uniref:Histone acetyltransferase HPA2/related acetyltransferase n=1 Tax=Hahella chejuensis (strain KCTC 2396) TaxID=349521 RepID=Q2SAU4_HAHCH|nr:GNAT family N-acetyltransferase [Hahella chejuensis]ABC32230.1 Histone acetyltransferase HPA2/related acetyltransferase [Hahella chejuensis KCTC 2396]
MKLNELVVRAATAADTPDLSRIFFESRKETFYWIEADMFSIHDFLGSVRDEEVYVADHEGVAVGFVSVWKPESFIHNLYVDKPYKNRGVGTALLEFCRRRYAPPLQLKVAAKNEQAVAFYRHRGWCEIERGVDLPTGEYLLMHLTTA